MFLPVTTKFLTFYCNKTEVGEIIRSYEDILRTNETNTADEMIIKKYLRKIKIQVTNYIAYFSFFCFYL